MALIIANTEHGFLEGQRCGDPRVSVFKGIPYAKPPVGELRWRAPMPDTGWLGVRRALEYSKIPVQPKRPRGSFYQKHFFPLNPEQSEDCLYLNIWTPAEEPGEKLPVAFWIYGGGYTTGYSNKIEFDGEAFARRGCVFVSFNYRLGIIGFLAHPELSQESADHISGNYGLLDQIAALAWVRENIAAFGGDPDNITVFGQSAGAMSCMNLCNTPRTEGMIKRAILESCGGLNVEMYRKNSIGLKEAEEYGAAALKAMGIRNIEEARTIDAYQLVTRLVKVTGFQQMSFYPVADGCILPIPAITSIMRGQHQKVDYMIGSTANEGYGFNEGRTYDPVQYKEDAKAVYGDEADNFLKAVDYMENGPQMPADNFGDAMLSAGIAWNELEMKRGGSTAYQYYFTKEVPGEESGAFHSAEHAYIFQTLDRFTFPYKGSDYELSNIMCDYWCNFIKTGDPNGPGLPVWHRYQSGPAKIMELGEEVRMIDIPKRPGAVFDVDYMVRQAEREMESAEKNEAINF